MDMKLMVQVRRLVEKLTAGRYAEITASGQSGRLTEEELRRTVEEYGQTLIPLPDDNEVIIDIYEQPSLPGTVSMDVSLWTQEEGRSDLTLSPGVETVFAGSSPHPGARQKMPPYVSE